VGLRYFRRPAGLVALSLGAVPPPAVPGGPRSLPDGNPPFREGAIRAVQRAVAEQHAVEDEARADGDQHGGAARSIAWPGSSPKARSCTSGSARRRPTPSAAPAPSTPSRPSRPSGRCGPGRSSRMSSRSAVSWASASSPSAPWAAACSPARSGDRARARRHSRPGGPRLAAGQGPGRGPHPRHPARLPAGGERRGGRAGPRRRRDRPPGRPVAGQREIELGYNWTRGVTPPLPR
jgi:hypothetical protein